MPKEIDELGDELCEHCPLEKKGSYHTPNSLSAGCEGSSCNEAYEIYLEECASEIEEAVENPATNAGSQPTKT